jgi:hypothetical protein
METSSFALLIEMKKYDDDQLTEQEKIDFVQLLIDMDLIWIMEPRWVHRAENYLTLGKCYHINQFVRPDGTIAKDED